MAKHPHKLILLQKKTWRCTLPGCNFFVHIGLQHVLVGKQGTCWQCNEEFTVDYKSLQDEMPMCYDCKMGNDGRMSMNDRENYIEAKIALAQAGVTRVQDLDPGKRRMLETIKGIDFTVLEREQNEPAPVTTPVVTAEEKPIEDWEREQSREYLETKNGTPPTEEEIMKNIHLRRKVR